MADTDRTSQDRNVTAAFGTKVMLVAFVGAALELVAFVIWFWIFDPPHPRCPDWTIIAGNGSRNAFWPFVMFPAFFALVLGWATWRWYGRGKKRWVEEQVSDGMPFGAVDINGHVITNPYIAGSIATGLSLLFGGIPFLVYLKECW